MHREPQRGDCEFAANHGASVEVIVAGLLAQAIEVDLARRVARKGVAASAVEEGLEAQFESGVGLVVHLISPAGRVAWLMAQIWPRGAVGAIGASPAVATVNTDFAG